ncbi:LysR family transcriptional regulator [Spongiibacter marinus]|uniref:LysR family transcriptional regulator n=1 Tax=Spongiibacter marinus TaxID=354246 RepID=UPI0004273D12|nr:LysR family transcriptional regulator [Spongiibacter marinus]
MINTVWLRSFYTLVDVGHFTRTAQQLHMTQSGVSQHIRKLEEQLGVELLVREGKQFRLSPAGERLYAEAQGILLSLANLEHTVSDDPPFEGRVRVMSPGSVGLKLYPKLLALQRQHPALIIEYRFAPNSEVEQALAEAKIDIGLMSARPTTAELSARPVTEEPLLLVTPASLKQPNWQSLLALGFIDHPDGSHHANLLLGANFPEFQHCGQFERRGFSNQIGLILEPVSMGLGFTVLPAYAVEAFHNQKKICVHRLAQPVSETLYLCVARRGALARRTETVIAEAERWL